MRRSFALCLTVLACALLASFVSRVHAQQARTVKDGVYTAAQAKRGETIYQNQCVGCHGGTLAGGDGPPLAGQSFLDVWDRLPLSDLFDKIQNTMPNDAPQTLTRPQVADLVAFMLQANKFPAGRAELDAGDAVLRQISFGSAATRPSSAATGPNGVSRSWQFEPGDAGHSVPELQCALRRSNPGPGRAIQRRNSSRGCHDDLVSVR